MIEEKPVNPKADEWAERIAAKQRRGISVKQFCKDRGLTNSSGLRASLYAGAAHRNDCLYPLESQVDILKATAPQIVLVDHEIDAPSLASPIHASAVTTGIQLK